MGFKKKELFDSPLTHLVRGTGLFSFLIGTFSTSYFPANDTSCRSQVAKFHFWIYRTQWEESKAPKRLLPFPYRW